MDIDIDSIKYPNTHRLYNAQYIHVNQNYEVLGTASDGREIELGSLRDTAAREATELFLTKYPFPSQW
jgi:hypothetical protein